MDCFHLKVFKTVVNERSFSKAGEILHLTQPAVSYQIQALEDYFGGKLLNRSQGEEVTLTGMGEVLLGYAERILALYEEAEREITKLKGSRLLIGAGTTLGQYVLPKVIGSFKKGNSGVHVLLEVANSRALLEQLNAGALDLILLQSPINNKNFLSEFFLEDELVLIVSPIHPFAQKGRVELDEVRGECFILREEESGTRRTIEEILRGAGLKLSDLNVKMELPSPEAVKTAVEENQGISIISRWAILKEQKLNSLKEIEIANLRFKRNFYCIVVKQRLTKCLNEFIEFLKRWSSNL
jgi:DNA-binding transcriptional LysR family regulator